MAAGPASALETGSASPAPQPPAADSPDRRCTADGSLCIAAATYVADVCGAIEAQASENALDPHFLARLLWKESLFEPSAVSPAGAQGIAQFMPGTARIVGLDDPFNPAKAITHSARYLRKLTEVFGNIGLAAVAYNGGERRAATFLGGGTVLPWETHDYVEAITGHNAWKWRDDPPEIATLDLRLKGETPFLDACIELAGNRTLKEFRAPESASPWGVILASHPRQSGASAQAERLNRALRPVIGDMRVAHVRKRMPGQRRAVYTAQIGFDSRAEANRMCVRLRAAGATCIVLRN
ncbi:transglycosylase SLT domain-containing protein [Paracoccus sp. S-4012]|nr:lytic transglycosylase domain-containing protein [Paracoccus sp. S-4012]MRX50896.1 transglycosylase SLT domain-containing protein [Paracoccus sp. S-4012]